MTSYCYIDVNIYKILRLHEGSVNFMKIVLRGKIFTNVYNFRYGSRNN